MTQPVSNSEIVRSLIEILSRKDVLPEKKFVVPVVEKLRDILRNQGNEIATRHLREILRMSSTVDCFITVTENGRGCWAGCSTSHRSEREVDLSNLRQIARQELLRRGEPEKDAGRDDVPDDDINRRQARRYWRRKSRFRKEISQLEILRRADGIKRKKALRLLAGALQDNNRILRRTAVEAAGTLNPVPLEIIAMVAEDSSTEVLLEAVRVLENTGGEDAALILGRIARHSRDEQVTAGVIGTLGTIRDPESTGILSNLYQKTGKIPIKKLIIRSIANAGGPEALQLLTEALANPDEEIMETALKALHPYGDPILYDAVSSSMKICSESTFVRNMDLLSNWSDPASVDVIEPFMSDPSPRVRLAAAKALNPYCSPRVSSILIEALNDSDREVRLMALSGVSLYHSIQCRNALEKTLDHPDTEMARKAIEGLCGLMNAPVAPILVRSLEHPDPIVRLCAAAGLLMRKNTDALQTVEDFLKGSDLPLQERAVKVLAERGGEDGLTILSSYLPEASGRIQRSLVDVFSRNRFPGVIPGLERLLSQTSGGVQAEVAAALNFQGWKPRDAEQTRLLYRLTGNFESLAAAGLPEAVEPLRKKAMSTSSDQDLISCCRELAGIDDPSAIKALTALLNTLDWNRAGYPAMYLVKMDKPLAYQGLVNHVFGPKPVKSVEDQVITEAGAGVIRYIIRKTDSPEKAEKAVKLLTSILQNRASIVSKADLEAIASMAPSAIVIKTTIEACEVVLRPTSQVKPLYCDWLRQLAKQELSRRDRNG